MLTLEQKDGAAGKRIKTGEFASWRERSAAIDEAIAEAGRRSGAAAGEAAPVGAKDQAAGEAAERPTGGKPPAASSREAQGRARGAGAARAGRASSSGGADGGARKAGRAEPRSLAEQIGVQAAGDPRRRPSPSSGSGRRETSAEALEDADDPGHEAPGLPVRRRRHGRSRGALTGVQAARGRGPRRGGR